MAILEDGFVRDMGSFFRKVNQRYAFQPVDLSSSSLNETRLLVIPSGGLHALWDSEFFRKGLEDFVGAGGTIIVFAQQHGYEYGALPVPVDADNVVRRVGGYGWFEDQACQWSSVYIDQTHQVFSGLTRINASLNVDGYFETYPSSATVLLRRSSNGQPAAIMYEYGLGKVVAASVYSDFGIGIGQATLDDVAFTRDLIAWAANPVPIPAAQRGEAISFAMPLTNDSATDNAASVNVRIYSPGKKSVLAEQMTAVALPAGQPGQVGVSYQASSTSPLGIYPVEATLYDSNGSIIHPVETVNSSRLAVYAPLVANYTIDGVRMSLTVPTEIFFWHYPMTFKATIWNFTDNTQRLRLYTGWSHGGMTYLDEVVVPARGTLAKDYTIGAHDPPPNQWNTTDYSTNLWVHVFSESGLRMGIQVPNTPDDFPRPAEPWSYAGSFTKGISYQSAPRVFVSSAPAKYAYKTGETAAIATTIHGQSPYTWMALVKTTVVDPDYNVIFSDVRALTVPSYAKTFFTLSFPLSAALPFGYYRVRTDVLYEATGMYASTDQTGFSIPMSGIIVFPKPPSTFSAGINDILFDLRNSGDVPISSGQLRVSVSDPDGAVVFDETRAFSVDVGQTISLTHPVSLPPLKFGSYTMTYAQSDETRVGKPTTLTLYNSSPNVAFNFNRSKYRMRDTVNLDLELKNTDRFVLDPLSVAVSVPDAGYAETKAVSLAPDNVARLAYAFAVPEVVTAGRHEVIITLSLPSGSSRTFGADISVPASALTVGCSGPVQLGAGASMNVTIENTGGVDTSYVASEISLRDARGVSLYDAGAGGAILAGETKSLVDIPVPPQAADGPAYLRVVVQDSTTGSVSNLARIIDVAGVTAMLSAMTDKPAYTATEPISALSNVTTHMIGIDNATLKLAVDKVGAAGTGEFTNFVPKEYWPFAYLHRLAVGANDVVFVTDMRFNPVTHLAEYQVEKFDSSGKFLGKWGTWGTGDGQFVQPSGVAVGPDGSVYVADSGMQAIDILWDSGIRRIQKYDGNGIFVAQWGTKGTGDGQFIHPSGVSVGQDGSVYVTDFGNNCVQKFDGAGNFVARWGTPGTGDGQFNGPEDIAVGPDGFLYVANAGNNRIQKCDQNWTYVAQWGGSGSGDGQFSAPAGLAVSPDGSVYVSDSGNARIQKFSASGTFVGKWGSLGQENGQFGVGPPSGVFPSPAGIAVGRGGNLYVADSGNHRVQKFDQSGNYLAKWGAGGGGDGWLFYPYGIARDSAGYLYVTDFGNYRIQKFDRDGNFVAKWGSYGSGDGQLSGPIGIAAGLDGSVYVSESGNHRIQKFDANGNFVGKWGVRGSGPGEFNNPTGVAVGPDGSVYVADTYNARIQKFDANGNFITAFSTLMYNPWYQIYATLQDPEWVAVGPDGAVYVVETGYHAVRKFDGNGSYLSTWGGNGTADGRLSYPEGIAVDSNGFVYVVDSNNNRVQKFSGYGTFVEKWAGTDVFGDATFNYAMGIAVDPDGSVYVSDRNNGRIQKMAPAGGGGFTRLFETTLPVTQDANTPTQYTTPIGTLGATGKLYLTADIKNSVGQVLASAEYPFYVVEGNTLLLFSADKKVYRPGEAVTITGEVKNLSVIDAAGLNLALAQGSQSLYSAAFDVPAGGSYPFTATTTASNVGSYPLKGTVTQNGSNLAEIVDQYDVASPTLTAALSAPSVVGNDPFDLSVEFKNTGKVDASVGFPSPLDNQAVSVSIPAGETRKLVYTLQVASTTTYTITITGDLAQTVSTTVNYGLAASIAVGAASVYSEGTVSIPVTITNSGQLEETVAVMYALAPSATTQSRTYSVSAGGSVSDTLYYTLSQGTYTLTASCESPAAATQAGFSVKKAVDADITASIGPESGGALPVSAVLTNTGYDAIAGTVLYTVSNSQGVVVWSGEESVTGLQPLGSQNFTFSVTPASFDPGTYTVNATLVGSGGAQFAAQTASFVNQGPLFQITQLPPAQTFNAGQAGEMTFAVLNAGNQGGFVSLQFRAYDLKDAAIRMWLDPGQEQTFTFDFVLPDDLEEKDYFADYRLVKDDGGVLTSGQIKYHLAGVNLTVAASLDKQSYSDGEVARLILDLQSQAPDPRSFIARVNYSGYELQQEVTLAGAQTVTFDVPLTRVTGEKMFYGIYVESGRSIHLNSLYVHRAGDALKIVTDNQVYGPSGTVTFTVASGPGGPSGGTLTVSALDYTESVPFSGAVTRSLTLPSFITAGTYTISAQVTSPDGTTYSATHPVDVAGVRVRVTESTLDKSKYAPGDTVIVRQTISSNTPLAATVKAWVLGPDGNSVPVGDNAVSISQSENTPFEGRYPLSAGVAGIHRLVYGIYANNVMVASGSKAFDVGGAVLYGISTDKTDYPTHTEAVTVNVSAYGTGEAQLEFLVDGEFVKSEPIVFHSIANAAVSLPNVNPGGHKLKCVLSADGLTSTKETVFLYGTNLPDLVVDVAPPRLAPGMDNAFLIAVAVTNQGKTASEPTTVAIYDGEIVIGTINVDALSPGETRGYELLWDVLGKAGPHALKAIVNASGTVLEFDAGNNLVNADAAVPDVALATRTELETYKIGKTVAIVSSVRNLTSGTAFDNLSVATTVTDPSGQAVFSDTAVVASIGPGGGVSQTAAWSTTGLSLEGDYTIKQTVSSGTGLLAQTSKSVTLVKPPDFTIGPINDYAAIRQGQQATFTVSVQPLNGWNAELALRIEGLPPGASAVLGVNRLTPPGEVVVQVSAGATTEARQYTLSIVGEGTYEGETVTRQLPLTLDVSGFGLNAVDPTRTAIQLEPAVFDVNLGFLNGYAGTVALGVEGVPRGTRAMLDLNTATAPGPLKLTVQTSKYARPGIYSMTLKGNDGLVTHELPLTLVLQANPAIAQGIIATQGAGAQNEAAVRFFNGTYLQLFEFMAFDTYFGANAASADLDGDGIDEIVAARGGGSTNPATLKAFTKAGVPIVEHTPIGSLYGLVVASGDFDGDWKDEIVAAMGPDPNNPSTIKVLRFDGAGFVETGVSFDAFGASDNVYGYGANLAVGDMDGDGVPEIVAAPGPGPQNPSRVRVFKIDASGIPGSWSVVGTGPDFIAFPGLTYGVDIATGDVDGDGAAEIIVGTGPGPNTMPLVRIYKGDGTYTGVEFVAYPDLHNSYGVSVAGVDVNGDGITEVVTGSRQGPLDIAWINVFSPGGVQLGSFLAFPDRVKYGVKVFRGNVGQ